MRAGRLQKAVDTLDSKTQAFTIKHDLIS